MTNNGLDINHTYLGIELGSTRIKGTLIDEQHKPIFTSEFAWENKYEEGLWTYNLNELWSGIQCIFKSISNQVLEKHGKPLTRVGSICFSAMMHGYLPFDKDGSQLTAFRTWRNTNTEEASKELSSLFKFNIPHRWSIAHLYQAILNEEEHINQIDYITTLAGYVHWKLTGSKVLGVGDASGVFPINSKNGDYDASMIKNFDELIAQNSLDWNLSDVLPEIKYAGEEAGILSEEGARLLDPTGILEAGIPLAPPEGDAGTGMVATNSIEKLSGNVSAGTSIFSMTVLDRDLKKYYKEIDIVATPAGDPVAMVHCNNFTSDINDWFKMFTEMFGLFGLTIEQSDLYENLFKKAMEADENTGDITVCSYYAGEPITRFQEGRPVMVRKPDSELNLANFMLSHIYSSLATLRIGMDILIESEDIKINQMNGHGGFFKTEIVSQQIMADVLNVPVSVLETSGEGGAWGAAILAAYAERGEKEQDLDEYLSTEVFASSDSNLRNPLKKGRDRFNRYLERYYSVLHVERKAIEKL